MSFEKMFGIMRRSNRGGKTYESLKWLSENGGGVFVTNSPSEAEVLIKELGYENIEVVNGRQKSIVVDNVDANNILVTHTFPLGLWPFQPEIRNPHLPESYKL